MSGAECEEEVDPTEDEEEDEETVIGLGSYKGKVRMVRGDPSDEMMLLWGLQQPTFSKPNAFVAQSSLNLSLDACGRCLSISQSPSSLGVPGVTGSVMWDSGIVLGKFLENAVETGLLVLQGKKVVELGAGCGLVGCIAALLGSELMSLHGEIMLTQHWWNLLPDFVIGSDVIYSEEAVTDLLDTLLELSGTQTTIILAGELRNDAILEYFMEVAMEDFIIGRVDQEGWHPDYRSPRVAMYVMVKKSMP
ncbi:unnamed protein product [Lactuca virosa]|uniref:Uncharacterized protein n=1 Tax=Lactuca virosa TaxID=75947 RepID=A0AAU9LJS6_9ASTR|nr:unnamed protein product [Lactuca virosa]